MINTRESWIVTRRRKVIHNLDEGGITGEFFLLRSLVVLVKSIPYIVLG